MGTDRENIVPGDLYIMKGNIRYQQKAIFYIKKNYLYILRYTAAPKTLNTYGKVLYFK